MAKPMSGLEQALERLTQEQTRTEAQLRELIQAQARAEARTEGRVSGLEQALERLAQAQERTEVQVRELAQAQERTEARMEELAQAQARTEARTGSLEQALERLTQAQERTEARMEELAQAQTRTEESLDKLIKQVSELSHQVGVLSENIGFGLEDIARTVLPAYLKYRFGLTVKYIERRLFWVNDQQVEFDLYGEAKRNGVPVVLVGEVKSRIYRREVEQFRYRLNLVRPQIEQEVFPLMFGYYIHTSAEEAARGEIPLIASYQPNVEMHARLWRFDEE